MASWCVANRLGAQGWYHTLESLDSEHESVRYPDDWSD